MDNYYTLRALSFSVVASALGIDLSKYKHTKNEWSGPCPIHGGKKSNSFRYNDDGRFHCFAEGCKGRGSLDLVMQVRRISFKQAVELLTDLKPTSEPVKEKSPATGQIESITDCNELKPYSGSYEKFKVACPWLEQRIPDSEVLKRYGVFCYDNPKRKSAYSGRVMIPFRELDGTMYGYMGRAIEGQPKYLIPSNFPKSRFLFGADVLQGGAFGALPLKRIYLVESPFCVMKFASMGLPAVAAFGWSVSEVQISLLQQIAKGIYYLPDRNKRQESLPIACHIAESLWLRFPPLPVDDPENLTLEQILAL